MPQYWNHAWFFLILYNKLFIFLHSVLLNTGDYTSSLSVIAGASHILYKNQWVGENLNICLSGNLPSGIHWEHNDGSKGDTPSPFYWATVLWTSMELFSHVFSHHTERQLCSRLLSIQLGITHTWYYMLNGGRKKVNII